MGCDIHLFIEYRKKESKSGWWSFGAEFHLDRNYAMFGVLANVRVDVEDGFKPKGILEEGSMALRTNDALFLTITETGEEEYATTLSQAETWAGWGNKMVFRKNGDPWKIQDPDSHSHSWLTLEEYRQATQIFAKSFPKLTLNEDYLAVLAAMEKLEDDGKNEVRVVFWFDN